MTTQRSHLEEVLLEWLMAEFGAPYDDGACIKGKIAGERYAARLGCLLRQQFPVQFDPNPKNDKAMQMTVQIKALDALALALVAHNHRWTSHERELYERATASLKNAVVPTAPPSGGVVAAEAV